ncbi:MAG: hypothetical protein L3K17_02870, partial [Thermoplasmata archaeon]|nr:hypothetical protein [Thermoplasmata archaeon]
EAGVGPVDPELAGERLAEGNEGAVRRGIRLERLTDAAVDEESEVAERARTGGGSGAASEQGSPCRAAGTRRVCGSWEMEMRGAVKRERRRRSRRSPTGRLRVLIQRTPGGELFIGPRPPSSTMVDLDPSSSAKIAALEKELAELRRRLDALERSVAGMPEHGVDRRATRGKVVYDWQAPRP